jgi:hypothetical protein
MTEHLLCSSLEETLLLYKTGLPYKEFIKFGGCLYKFAGDLIFGMLKGSPVGNRKAFYVVLEAMLDILTTVGRIVTTLS